MKIYIQALSSTALAILASCAPISTLYAEVGLSAVQYGVGSQKIVEAVISDLFCTPNLAIVATECFADAMLGMQPRPQSVALRPLPLWLDQSTNSPRTEPMIDVRFAWAARAWRVEKMVAKGEQNGSWQNPSHPGLLAAPVLRFDTVHPCTAKRVHANGFAEAMRQMGMDAARWSKSNPWRLFGKRDTGQRSLANVLKIMNEPAAGDGAATNAPLRLNVMFFHPRDTDVVGLDSSLKAMGADGHSGVILVEIGLASPEAVSTVRAVVASHPFVTLISYNTLFGRSTETGGTAVRLGRLLAAAVSRLAEHRYLVEFETQDLADAPRCQFEIGRVGGSGTLRVTCVREIPVEARLAAAGRISDEIRDLLERQQFEAVAPLLSSLAAFDPGAEKIACDDLRKAWQEHLESLIGKRQESEVMICISNMNASGVFSAGEARTFAGKIENLKKAMLADRVVALSGKFEVLLKGNDYSAAAAKTAEIAALDAKVGAALADRLREQWKASVKLAAGKMPDGQQGVEEAQRMIAAGLFTDKAADAFLGEIRILRAATVSREFEVRLGRQAYRDASGMLPAVEELAGSTTAQTARDALRKRWREHILALADGGQIDGARLEMDGIRQSGCETTDSLAKLAAECYWRAAETEERNGGIERAATLFVQWKRAAADVRNTDRAMWQRAHAAICRPLASKPGEADVVAAELNDFSRAQGALKNGDPLLDTLGAWLSVQTTYEFFARAALLDKWQDVDLALASGKVVGGEAFATLWACIVHDDAAAQVESGLAKKGKMLSLMDAPGGTYSLSRAVRVRPLMALAVSLAGAWGVTPDEFNQAATFAAKATNAGHGTRFGAATAFLLSGEPILVTRNNVDDLLKMPWAFVERVFQAGKDGRRAFAMPIEDAAERSGRKTAAWLVMPFAQGQAMAIRFRDDPSEASKAVFGMQDQTLALPKVVEQSLAPEHLALTTYAVDLAVHCATVKSDGADASEQRLWAALQKLREQSQGTITDVALHRIEVRDGRRVAAATLSDPDASPLLSDAAEFCAFPVTYASMGPAEQWMELGRPIRLADTTVPLLARLRLLTGNQGGTR